MKILQLGKFYPIRGGVEKVMRDLTEGLGERGVQCDMLCATLDYPDTHIVELNPNSRIICVPAVTKKAATMLSPEMITYLRHHHDYDLIHIHHPDPMAALALKLSGYKGKVIVHWHSDIIKQKTILKFYMPLQKWMLQRANLIVGTTPVYVKESPHLRKFQAKTLYLPIGVKPVEADSELVASFKARFPGKKIIFALGRFVEYKGFEYLVKAVKLLPDNYHVVIGGEGPLKEDMERLAMELGQSEKITFTGWVDDKERPAWFQACDLFVLSSVHKTEAFAIVQIEAMSCGKPVVATKIPASGVSWVNADGVSGRNVPIKNAKALADAIMNICEDSDLYEQYSEGARTRYLELFTKEKMISGCLDIYDTVLRK